MIVDGKRMWKLILGLITEEQLKLLATLNDDFEFPVKDGTKLYARTKVKSILGIPEHHYNGERCDKCDGYLWWDGTCSRCSEEETEQTIAQAIRGIAEKLGGGGDALEAVDELWELADELDPEGSDNLLDYVEERDD